MNQIKSYWEIVGDWIFVVANRVKIETLVCFHYEKIMSAPPKKSAEKPVKQKPIKKEDDGEGSSPEDIPKNPNIAPTKVKTLK